MTQRARPAEVIPVGLFLEDGVPVVHVEQGGKRFPETIGELVAGKRRSQNQSGKQRDYHRRHKAPEPAQPEGAERQVALLVPRTHEVRGDEVTREREEHAHAHESPDEAGNVQVVQHNHGNCDRPQPVESGYVPLILVYWARHVKRVNLYPKSEVLMRFYARCRRVSSDFAV